MTLKKKSYCVLFLYVRYNYLHLKKKNYADYSKREDLHPNK